MALHKDLPIYATTYELLAHVVKLAKNMPRDFKHSMGGKLRDECLEISVMVFRANVAHDKSPYLYALIERLQVVELTLRLARDLQLISIPNYSVAVEHTTSIGKQANAWKTQQGSLFS